MATITQFDWNWQTGQATLEFDTAVSALDLSKISVATSNLGANAVPLSGTVTGLGTTTITIAVDQNKLYVLQQAYVTDLLLTSLATGWIYITDASATEPAISTVPLAVQVLNLTATTAGAQVLAIAYKEPPRTDTTNSVPWNIAVTYNRVLDAATLVSGVWNVQTTAGGGTVVPISFTSSDITFNSNNTTVYLKFPLAAWNTLRVTAAGASLAACYLVITSVIRDVFNQTVIPVTQQPTVYTNNSSADTAYILNSPAALKIRGGSANQFLQTDGTGNLSWATVTGGGGGAANSIFDGTSNVFVYPSANVAVSVAGAVVANFTAAGVTVSNTVTANNAVLAANLTVGNVANITGNAVLGANLSVANSISAGGSISANANIAAGNNLTVSNNIITGNVVAGTNVQANYGVYTANFSANGANVSLGNISNLRILGGTPGQALTTTGSGNLAWASIGLSNADTNISILGTGVFISAAGAANVGRFISSGLVVGGNLSATGNIQSRGANTEIQFNNAGNLAGDANLTFDYANANLVVLGNIQGTLANGTSNISMTANGDIVIARNGNVQITYGYNGNTFSDLVTIAADTQFDQNVTIIGNLQVLGNTTQVNVAVLDVQDPYISLGNAANGSPPNDGLNRGLVLNYDIGAGAQTGFIGLVADPTDTLGLGNFFLARTAANSSNNFTATQLGTLRLLTLAANTSVIANTITANLSVTANAIVGVSANISNTLRVDNTATFIGNAEFSGANVSLGSVSNLHIDGGTANWFLRTDGSGTLTWSNVLPAVTTSGVITTISGAVPNANLTQDLGASSYWYRNVYANTAIASNLTIGTTTIDSGNARFGGDVRVAGNLDVIGNFALSNISFASASSTTFIDGNGIVVTDTGNSRVSATISATAVTFDGANIPVSLGSVTNLSITGGLNGQYLQTDGAGNLVWANSAISSSIENGTSNVRIPTANGAITGAVNGTTVFQANTGVFAVTGLSSATTEIRAPLGNFTTINGTLNAASASQPNITQVGTLTTLTVSTAITGTANLQITGNIAARGTTGQLQYNNAGNLAGTTGVTYAGNNITSTGNITANNLAATAAITAVTITTTGAANLASINVGAVAPAAAPGEIFAVGDITAFASDDRLKTRLGDIENAVSKVEQLSTFYFEFNERAVELGLRQGRYVGVSAQETQSVLPEIVRPAPVGDGMLTVQYDKFAPLLIEAIKELAAEQRKLRADIDRISKNI